MIKVLLALVVIVGVGFVVLRGNPDESTVQIPKPGPIEGLVTNVTAENVTIKTGDNKEVVFANQATNISLDHLKEHQLKKEPVSIKWSTENGVNIAISIDDVL